MECRKCATIFESKYCPECGAPAVEEGGAKDKRTATKQLIREAIAEDREERERLRAERERMEQQQAESDAAADAEVDDDDWF